MPTTNPRLEAAILSAIDAPDNWAVYSDWLQLQNDPRGEILALALSLEKQPDQAPIRKQLDLRFQEFKTKMLVPRLLQMERRDNLRLKWKGPFLLSAQIIADFEHQDKAEPAEILSDIYESEVTTFFHSLSIEFVGQDFDYQGALFHVITDEKRPRALRNLKLKNRQNFKSGLTPALYNNKIFDVDLVLNAMKDLETLDVDSRDVSPGLLNHSSLKHLRLSFLKQDKLILEYLRRFALPSLETLQLGFGEQVLTAEHFMQKLDIFFKDANLPCMKNLQLGGLQPSHLNIPTLIKAPFFTRLQDLDLSQSQMDQNRADELLKHAPAFQHLKSLRLKISGTNPRTRLLLKKHFRGIITELTNIL